MVIYYVVHCAASIQMHAQRRHEIAFQFFGADNARLHAHIMIPEERVYTNTPRCVIRDCSVDPVTGVTPIPIFLLGDTYIAASECVVRLGNSP